MKYENNWYFRAFKSSTRQFASFVLLRKLMHNVLMKRSLLAIMLAAIVCGPACAQSPAPPADDLSPMQQCQSYADCTIVWGGCSDVAINKAYVSQLKQATVCLSPKPHDPKADPTCKQGRCVAVDITKGGGE
jgi:hypothetical protein